LLLALLALLMPIVAAAFTPLAARYPIRTSHAPPIFAAVSSAAGTLVLGTSEGVAEFDGLRWQEMKLPGPVRAMVPAAAAGGVDRIWIGGFDVFGTLDRQADGSWRFDDLRPRFDAPLQGRNVSEIWRIHVRAEGVFVGALRDLFWLSHDGRPLGHWYHEGRFGEMADWGGKLVVQWRGIGLRRLEGETFVDIPNSQIYAGSLVSTLVGLDDGSLLVGGPQIALQRFDGQRAEPLGAWARPDEQRAMQGARMLPDGRIAFGALDGWLRVFDLQQRRIARMRLAASFAPPPLHDPSGALWVVEGDKMLHMPWPSAWGAYDAGDHGPSDAYVFKQVDDRLYVGSTRGLDAAAAQPPGAPFAPTNLSPDHSAWDVTRHGDALIVAGHQNVHVTRAGRTTTLPPADLYPRGLIASRRSAGVHFVPTEEGLAVLTPAPSQPARFELRVHHRGLAREVRDVVEVQQRTGSDPQGGHLLWLGSLQDGVVRVHLSDDFRQVLERRRFGPAEGLPEAQPMYVSVQAIDGSVIAGTAAGLFRWNGARFEPHDGFGAARLRAAGEVLWLRKSPRGEWFAYGERVVLRKPLGGEWRSEAVSAFREGVFQSLDFDDRGEVLLAGSNALYRSSLQEQAEYAERARQRRALGKLAPDPPRPAPLRLSTVWVEDGAAENPQRRRASLAGLLELPAGSHKLRFELGYVDFARSAPPRFRARLLGFEQAFSPWGEQAVFDFRLLAPGRYRFEAEARDEQGRELKLAPFELHIAAHWWQTPTAQALAVLAALLLLAAAVIALARWRTRALDALVRQRTAELQDAVARLDALASLDGLTGVANRRRFDDLLARTLAAARANGEQPALLLIDVDHFKAYNDRHGHLGGDEALKDVARLIADLAAPQGGAAARFGGEEFAVLLVRSTAEAARELAERIRLAVADLPQDVTVSIGVALARPQHDDAAALIARADQALYAAKDGGRNQVRMADA
jgi:diguanylate cyclase (GGDEF)-like protein